MFIAELIASKLGLTGAAAKIIEVLMIISLVGGLYAYHKIEVGNLETNVATLTTSVSTLKQNQDTLIQTNKNNQDFLTNMQQNFDLLNNLEKKNEEEQRKNKAREEGFKAAVLTDEKKLGNKPLTPLLATELDRLSQQDAAAALAAQPQVGVTKNVK